MKDAGFEGFDRGERGSTAENLTSLGYKIQQDEKRLADGTLPEGDKKILRDLADWMAVNREAIHGAKVWRYLSQLPIKMRGRGPPRSERDGLYARRITVLQ